jgi:hypothetical protein
LLLLLVWPASAHLLSLLAGSLAAPPSPHPMIPLALSISNHFFPVSHSYWFIYRGKIVQKKFSQEWSLEILNQEELLKTQFYSMTEQGPSSNKRPITRVI